MENLFFSKCLEISKKNLTSLSLDTLYKGKVKPQSWPRLQSFQKDVTYIKVMEKLLKIKFEFQPVFQKVSKNNFSTYPFHPKSADLKYFLVDHTISNETLF